MRWISPLFLLILFCLWAQADPLPAPVPPAPAVPVLEGTLPIAGAAAPPPAAPSAPAPDDFAARCLLDNLKIIQPSLADVALFIRALDPKLVALEKTPGWQDIENLRANLQKLKDAKSDLASQGKLADAENWAKEAAEKLKTDPMFTAIVSEIHSSKLDSAYQPGEYALKRLYGTLLYELDRELPGDLRLPLEHLPHDARRKILLAKARALILDQEKRFAPFISTTGFPSMERLKTAVRSYSDEAGKLVDAFDKGDVEIGINRPENARWWVPKVGFQNQRTTGSSRGSMSPDWRDKAEAGLLGFPYSEYKNFDNELKPEYGYLAPALDSGLTQSRNADQYGEDKYVFKNEAVIPYLTFTTTDSLGIRVPGADTGVPQPRTYQDFFIPWRYHDLIVPQVIYGIARNKTGFDPGTDYSNSDLPAPPPPKPPQWPAPPTQVQPPPLPPSLQPLAAPPYPIPPPPPEVPPWPDAPAIPEALPGEDPHARAQRYLQSDEYKKYEADLVAQLSSDAYRKHAQDMASYKVGDAFKKYQSDAMNYSSSPAYQKYLADNLAYVSSDAYKSALAEYQASDTYKKYLADLTASRSSTDFADYYKRNAEFQSSDAFAVWSELNMHYMTSVPYLAYQDLAQSIGGAFQGTSLAPLKGRSGGRYVELQYLGPRELSDVRIFRFKQTPPSGDFLKALRKYGIRIEDARVTPPVEWVEPKAP